MASITNYIVLIDLEGFRYWPQRRDDFHWNQQLSQHISTNINVRSNI